MAHNLHQIYQNRDHHHLLVGKPSHANGHGRNKGDSLSAGRDEPVCESYPRKTLQVENVQKTFFFGYYHFQREVGEPGAKREDGTSGEHSWPCTRPANQESRQRHRDTLCHPPDRLDNDEVTVGQVWRPVVPSKHKSAI